MKKEKPRHAEAFCLMQYQCSDCGAIEFVLNTRDGVTPFIIMSRCCKKRSQHVNWREDLKIQDLRIFVDMSKEEYALMLNKRYDNAPEKYKVEGKEREELFERRMKDFEDGQPMLKELSEIIKK